MVELRRVTKVFPGGVTALRQVSFKVETGELVAIVGPSGAGKSTLLRVINRLVEPTAGEVAVGGVDMMAARGEQLRRMRRRIGMIFQEFNLVKRSTVLRNVLAGRLGYVSAVRSLLGLFSAADIELAVQCLERLGIADKAYMRADTLSGGQQQRVAIARALAQQPRLMLADEPVAALDPPTAHLVMGDLQRINRELGLTMLINLHAVELARQYATRVIGLHQGEVVFDGPVEQLTPAILSRIYGQAVYTGGADRAAAPAVIWSRT